MSLAVDHKAWNNYRSIGALIYHGFIWNYKNDLPRVGPAKRKVHSNLFFGKNNSVTKKIQPKEGQLRIRDDLEPNSLTPRQRVFPDEEDVLYGMFTRDDIAIYFKSFDHMRTISDKINVFLKNMYSNCVYMAQKERLALAEEKISD